MITAKPSPLDKNLLLASLTDPSCHAQVRAQLGGHLDSGGDANAELTPVGHTLLEITAHNGWIGEAKCLLEHGADVHANNESALTVAAKNGRTGMVGLLIASGANVNIHSDWALRLAAENGHTDAVRLLLAAGADINALGDNNKAPLLLAAHNGHTAVVRLLLAHGADVHANNDEALRQAALNQHKPTTEVLLMAGANAVATTTPITRNQNAIIATLDACAAAIPADQRQGLLKAFGKQMPALSSLLRQEQRRSDRRAP